MKKIKLWWHDNEGINNFGDLLGPYLVEKITGRQVVFYPSRSWPWPKTFMVVGSILAAAKRNCIVWGAGIIEKSTKVGKAKFLAVRGPLTREILMDQGHEVPEVYGDPAILLPRFFDPDVEKEYEVGIIPHVVDYEAVKDKCTRGLKVIDLTKDVEEVITEIKKCKRTVSSSLHGLIVSHVYNIPSLWAKFSDQLYGDDIKFYDYLKSVGIDNYSPAMFHSEIPDADSLIKQIDNLRNRQADMEKLKRLSDRLYSTCPFI
ncbi:MAG: polysaccharide pyruvyl transferase family protein [Fulvivirga sp.]|nr:polysaccharide pyruvyl transferase family protein [Fulvivirga sp.]